MRSSSGTPSSNSWFPPPVTSSPSAFIASIAGSSWNSADTSGLAPMRSPAPTVIVLEFSSRSIFMCVARYSIPPARTVYWVHPVCVPAAFLTGVQQPTWMKPGVSGARFPWKSLIARSRTYVSLSFGPFAASACGAPSTSMSPSAASTAMVRLICVSPLPSIPLSRPAERREPSARVVSEWSVLRVGPGVADADLHRERRVERVRAHHLLADEVPDGARLDLGDLQEELVVHLEHEPRGATLAPEALVDPHHRDLDHVGGGALHHGVHSEPLAEGAGLAVRRTELRDRPPAAEQGRDVPVGGSLRDGARDE